MYNNLIELNNLELLEVSGGGWWKDFGAATHNVFNWLDANIPDTTHETTAVYSNGSYII